MWRIKLLECEQSQNSTTQPVMMTVPTKRSLSGALFEDSPIISRKTDNFTENFALHY